MKDTHSHHIPKRTLADCSKLVFSAKQATVIEKSSGEYSGKVVIPESLEHDGTTYSVINIGEGAFSECSDLTSITIPNSVTTFNTIL